MTAVRAALLVHGAGGGGWEWNVWRGVLEANGIAVVAPDLQPVAAGLAATGFDDYLQQARDALESLPRPRVLVGASLGGLLALGIADAADALVLVNPLPPAPWHASLPSRVWPDVVPWRRDARLDGTRRALPGADEATALFAFRHWRNESGKVLRTACDGLPLARPACPTLVIASLEDEDVPPAITQAMATAWKLDILQTLSRSHVGPLLGREAAGIAAQTVEWVNRAVHVG
ncbi:alpha/beta fold hydrolase [Pseudoxanthomonas sp. PXM02]|uniref:alpha/beta hydrolase n=1 Tax=Pseudoxanthomonas sp. PXM02 TaxID=2769294 RepID=UPI00177BA451|nr:alpha/beta fold hydrolase [Pseudoxanthomonas sp. PXM02]MBD9479611.1 alpha/beta hydrolase [Pseudoxanthomonas sp. PXM02]